MSDGTDRRYLSGLAVFLLVFIILLCSCLVFSHSVVVGSYYRDVVNNEYYCDNQYKAIKDYESAECQSFWYRTLNDPAISWSFYYSLLTGILVILAGGTIIVALRSVSIQKDHAHRLFVADQRPWIKADISFQSEPFHPLRSGMVMLKLSIKLSNVGKSPAFDVGDPGVLAYRHEIRNVEEAVDFMHRHPIRKSWNLKFIEERDRLRSAVRTNKFFVPSTTIHAGDDIVYDEKWAYVLESDAEATWRVSPQSCIFVYFSVPYKSVFEQDRWYETTIVCSVNNGTLAGWQIPRNEADIQLLDFIRSQASEVNSTFTYITSASLKRIDGLCVVT